MSFTGRCRFLLFSSALLSDLLTASATIFLVTQVQVPVQLIGVELLCRQVFVHIVSGGRVLLHFLLTFLNYS